VAMTADDVVALVADDLLPKWQTERKKLDRIDRWARWDHDDPHKPRHATREYRELAARAQAPWGDLVVGSVAQTLYVEGYRRPDAPDDSTGWTIWQANGWDSRQIAQHRAALTYGYAYATCLRGTTFTGEPMPVMRGVSPREMFAAYEDPANDDWPAVALRVKKTGGGFTLWVFDDELVYRLSLPDLAAKPKFDTAEAHDSGVCPVVRYANRFDLEGRCAGEIEPFIPVLGKIDQTSFDRLVVQRFGAWIVRYIAGMDIPESAKATNSTVDDAKMRLKVEDFLTASDPDTKFGSLPATPLDGYIKAHEGDLTTLAAVSQTPAYELLGQMANMSAEALAAARASLTAKSVERQHTFGEAHEQLIRLACHLAGDSDGAADFQAQVRWADTSIRSIAQAVDAYGKLVQMLGFPPEVLWPKVPGMTQQDVDEAKTLAAEGGAMDSLLNQLVAGQTSQPDVSNG
jgi:hypothetical protein